MKIVELETSGPIAFDATRRARSLKSRVDAGTFVSQRNLMTIYGQVVQMPDPQYYVHLQFRRFAGCPICDLHLRSFAQRHDDIAKAGIREIVVFHSPVQELTVHASELPFAVIADPQKRLYAEFDVEASMRSLLDPHAWGAIVRGVSLRLYEMLLSRKSAPSLHNTGGRLGLPADFLIASDGTVVASKYGVHAYDQWSVDDLLRRVPSKNAAVAAAQKERVTKSTEEPYQQLRQSILNLPGVTELKNAGIHEDAFFVARTMFMHIHGEGQCDIRLRKGDQERVLAEGKARPHRWAPESGYVTFIVANGKDVEPAMDLIRKSHEHFAAKQNAQLIETNGTTPERVMSLFVIGATGRTGREILEQGLARGHRVTVFVRSPENVRLKNERLAILKGNPMDEEQLVGALHGHDATISTLGPREVFKPSSMLHDSALATIRAMKRSDVKRLVVLSAAAHFPGVSNRIASFILRNHMRDSLAMEEIIQSSGLNWTIARPPRLTQGEYMTYRSREGAAPKLAFTLSRKAVAAFMLDAIEQQKHFHKIVGIAR